MFTLLHSFLLITSFILLIFAIYIYKFRSKTKLALPLFILLTCIFFHSFGYAFELTSKNAYWIYFWLRIEYIGIAFSPSFYLLFTLQYAGFNNLLKKPIVSLVVLFSFLTLIFQTTNCAHLFYKTYDVIKIDDSCVADFQKGIWYWLHQIYINSVLLICCIIYVKLSFSSIGRNKMRAFLMFTASLLPWFFYLIYIFDYAPRHIDLSPFAFSFVGILCTIGILKYQLLYIEPVAIDRVFNSIDEGIIIINKQKHLLQFNKHSVSLISELELYEGKNIETLLNKYFDLQEAINRSNQNSLEFPIVVNSEEHFYQVKTFAVRKGKYRVNGWLLVFINITRQKVAEKALMEHSKQQEEQNNNQTRFLAILGHDLRNPLHLITTISDLLVTEIQSGDYNNAEESARMLYDTAYTTSYLTENLLKWAQHIRNGLQFNKVLESLYLIVNEETELLHSQFRRKNIRYTIDIDQDLLVSVDKDMIRTVIRNLLNNAIKYSFQDEMINISAKIVENEIIVEVRDFGTGISGEDQEKMFTFENIQSRKGTASEIGTGIGLVLCKEFIEMHMGRIWVESATGKGSSFYFALPYN